MNPNQIDILTVSCNNLDFLNINYDLINQQYCKKKLNLKWWVVQNDPSEEFSDHFEIIEGIHPSNVRRPKEDELVGFASYHHAAGINKGLKYIRPDSKWLLLLDPDFFIFKPLDLTVQWLNKVDLDFFGAEYPPPGKIKRIRRFPIVYCMFVNTEKIDYKNFNFTPSKTQDTGYKVYQQYKDGSRYKTARHSTNCPFVIMQGIDYFVTGKKNPFGLHIHQKVSLAHGYSEGGGKKQTKNTWTRRELVNTIQQYRIQKYGIR